MDGFLNLLHEIQPDLHRIDIHKYALFAEAVGQPELADDPRFKTQPERARNQKALAEILERAFAEDSAAAWLAEMDRRGVPSAPINSYGDILADPHVAAMELVRPLTLANGVETQTVAFPVAMSDYRYETYRAPPELGAHNEEVLVEWTGAETRADTGS